MSRDLHRVAPRRVARPALFWRIRVTCFIYMMCHAGDASAAAKLPRARARSERASDTTAANHKSFMTSKCHSRNSLPAATLSYLPTPRTFVPPCTTPCLAIALFKKMHRHYFIRRDAYRWFHLRRFAATIDQPPARSSFTLLSLSLSLSLARRSPADRKCNQARKPTLARVEIPILFYAIYR